MDVEDGTPRTSRPGRMRHLRWNFTEDTIVQASQLDIDSFWCFYYVQANAFLKKAEALE